MLLAAVALICCFLGYHSWQERRRAEIAARYHAFCQTLAAKDYVSAYAMMTTEYQQANSLTVFRERFETPLPPLQPLCAIWFHGGQAEVYPYSTGFLRLLNGETYLLRYSDDEWLFTGEGNLYLD